MLLFLRGDVGGSESSRTTFAKWPGTGFAATEDEACAAGDDVKEASEEQVVDARALENGILVLLGLTARENAGDDGRGDAVVVVVVVVVVSDLVDRVKKDGDPERGE